MSPTRYSIGDVVEFDGVVFAVVGIAPARLGPELRYELREDAGRRTIFRRVDAFDERADVELVVSCVVEPEPEVVEETPEVVEPELGVVEETPAPEPEPEVVEETPELADGGVAPKPKPAKKPKSLL